MQDTQLREKIKCWHSQRTIDQTAIQKTEEKPPQPEDVECAQVSVEELQLPDPVSVCAGAAVCEGGPTEGREDGHQEYVEPLTSHGADLLLSESDQVTTVESEENDESNSVPVTETTEEVTEEPVARQEEIISEDHLIEETIKTLTSESPAQPRPDLDNPISSTEAVEILDVKLRDSEETENVGEEIEQSPSLISSETIALLFDPVEGNIANKKSPVKIDLKDSFKKLSDRIQVESSNASFDEDLEMFEKTPARDFIGKVKNEESKIVENIANESQEIRIIKVVDDVDTFEKINKIKEELDKTKQIPIRRKSEDVKLTVKPFEVKPIRNALQGLQALLKISGGAGGAGGAGVVGPILGEKKTVGSKSEGGEGFREKKEDKNDSSRCETQAKKAISKSQSRNSRSCNDRDTKTDRRSNSSRDSSKKRSKSRSPAKSSSRSRSRSRNQDRKSQNERRKENSKSIRSQSRSSRQNSSSDPSRGSSSRPTRGRSSSKETKRRQSTKINRAALVRDSNVEDEYKTLVENNVKSRKEPQTPQSTQMEKIRQTISTEQKKRAAVEEQDSDITVVSYKDVRPRCQPDHHVRIIRTLEDDPVNTSKWSSASSDKSKKVVKQFVEKERIVRKVYAVEKNVDGVSNFEKVTLEKSVKQTKEIHSKEERASVTPDRKSSLELIKEELERVKNRVDNIKNKSGCEQDSDSDAEMKSIMKDVKQMEAEVRDISEDNDVKLKPKKRKKGKERESEKPKEIEPEAKKILEDKDVETSKKKKNNEGKNDIEINAKLAKKILTSILGSNIGKTLNDVIRKEVDKTDSTIEKIKEDLKKQKEDKYKKKRKKEKEEKDIETGAKKKLKTEEVGLSVGRNEKKASPYEKESRAPEEESHPKKKSKKDKHKSPSKKTRKNESRDQSKLHSKRKKSKSDREKKDKERHKKKKSKKKHRRDYNSDSDNQEEVDEPEDDPVNDDPKMKVKKSENNSQEDFELVIGITEDDVAYLEQEDSQDKEPAEIVNVATTEAATLSGTTSNAVGDEDGGDSDDEVNLRALLLSQMAAGPRRSNSRAKITWSPARQQSEEKDSSVSYALPQYAYAFSRTFITHEEKQLYFPNLFKETLVPLQYSESESECEEDCEEMWDQRRTTNWVTSRMSDPRFSQAMESLLRQSRVSSPDDGCY